MMLKNITLTKQNFLITLLFILLGISTSTAQLYQHNFGTTNINTYPYTVAPNIIDPGLSNSVWTNNTGSWVSFIGSSGEALGLANSSGAANVTLTFTVAPGKQMTIDTFSFWRQRSPVGAQNWSMAINGINVGSGTIAQTAAATGTLPVANPVVNLTGNVNVVISLSNAPGVGTFRVDDFTLNGTITNTCVAPAITSISPASGPVNTIVALNGSGFLSGNGTTSVKFNGIDAQSYTIISDNLITATVPAGAATGAITVTTDSCPGTSPAFTVTSSACVLTPPPSDIYISELYDQQSGSGGMIEIYNPTSATIDLSDYTLQRYGNITDATPAAGYVLTLSGTLGSEMIYLVSCTTPNASICVAPSASVNLGNGFNGNDKFEILKNGVVIDRVDVPFTAPGYTLIRKPDAVAPAAVYNINDWNNTQHPADNSNPLPNNFCQDLGNHAVDPIPGSGTTPTITHPVSQTICENGSVSFSVTLSDPTGFTYQWKMLDTTGNWINVTNGSNYTGATSATLTINNIPAGYNKNQYYCEMTSGSTCIIISNAAQLIVNPTPATADVTTTQPTCTVTTGTIAINTPVGNGFTYSIDGTNFQTGTTFLNLQPGSYPVTVKSNTTCTSSTTVVINPAPLAPAIAAVTITQPTCANATGNITVNSPVGNGITYSIDGTTFQGGVTFANLLPNSYIITVKNAAGCTSVTNTIIINAAPVTPAIATTETQPTCTLPTGSVTVSSPVGTGLTYSIDGTNFQTGTIFESLQPGSYTVTLKNASGCTSVTNTILINPVPGAPAIADVTVAQPTCSAISTGSITVNSPIGNGLTYSIDGTIFQTSTLFSNLPSGSYIVTVKNEAGCTSITSTIIINPVLDAPEIANVTIIQPTCIVTTGSITITSPVDTGITYSIDGTNFQAGTTFANLQPGSYTITAKNTAGCTSVTGAIIINAVPSAPAVADITTVQPTCTIPTGSITINSPLGTDLTYSINGTDFQTEIIFANLQPGSYTITVKNAAGCTSVTNSIIINTVPGTPAVADVTIVQPICSAPTGTIIINSPVATDLTYSIDGINFQTATEFANLQPGSYTVTVKNAAGCTSVTNPVIINPVTGGPAIANTTITQPTCATPTGTITITSPVGTDLTYSINGTSFQTATAFANLQPGSYSITVRNAIDCTSVTNAIIINAVPNAPSITTTQGCRETTFGESYILEGLPSDSSFDINTASFKWTNAQGTVIGNNENTFDITKYVADNNINATDFPINIILTVTNAAGCENSGTFTVDSYFCNIPKGISPNNDGMNDSFNLTGMNVKTLKIFNRYGAEVYSANNYKNEWHGQSDNGNELPTGTYYYTIELAGQNGETGWVYINREEK